MSIVKFSYFDGHVAVGNIATDLNHPDNGPKVFPSGETYQKFSIAVDTSYNDSKSNNLVKRTVFLRCMIKGDNAVKNFGRFVKQGMRVTALGQFKFKYETNQKGELISSGPGVYQSKDGNWHADTEFEVDVLVPAGGYDSNKGNAAAEPVANGGTAGEDF